MFTLKDRKLVSYTNHASPKRTRIVLHSHSHVNQPSSKCKSACLLLSSVVSLSQRSDCKLFRAETCPMLWPLYNTLHTDGTITTTTSSLMRQTGDFGWFLLSLLFWKSLFLSYLFHKTGAAAIKLH